jgi:phosphatidylglycerol lysyltransferase
MKSNLKHIFGPFLGLLLFTAALWVLHHQLKTYHLHDILKHFHELSSVTLFSALFLGILSYLIMTGYDFLALRYIHHPLSYTKTALASFIGYAFSNNIGFSMIAGASVRYRLYTAWGLTTFEITQVIGFCTLTLCPWRGSFSLRTLGIFWGASFAFCILSYNRENIPGCCSRVCLVEPYCQETH